MKKKRQYSRKNQEFSDSFPHRVVGEVFRRQVLSYLRHSPRYNNDLFSVTVNSRQNNKNPLSFISIFSNINPNLPIFITQTILLPFILHRITHFLNHLFLFFSIFLPNFRWYSKPPFQYSVLFSSFFFFNRLISVLQVFYPIGNWTSVFFWPILSEISAKAYVILVCYLFLTGWFLFFYCWRLVTSNLLLVFCEKEKKTFVVLGGGYNSLLQELMLSV